MTDASPSFPVSGPAATQAFAGHATGQSPERTASGPAQGHATAPTGACPGQTALPSAAL